MEKIFFKGLSFIVDRGVYKPSDDSFLLARHGCEARGKILDIGTGCGIGAIVACAANKGNSAVGADISRKAVQNARRNARRNGVLWRCEFLVSDLFGHVDGKFDVILFNPPYLPADGATNALWDGGNDGRKLIDRFLDGFERHLKADGKVIMVDSSLDGTEKTVEKLEERGFRVHVLERKRFFFEVLSVIEAARR